MENLLHAPDPNPFDNDDLLVFRVGKHRFCTHSFVVITALNPVPVTSVPLTPDAVKGVINYDNKATPVWCLRTYFNTKDFERNDTGEIIITKFIDGIAGFWVDETLGNICINKPKFQTFGNYLGKNMPVNKFLLHEDQMLFFVDFEQLYLEIDKERKSIATSKPQTTEQPVTIKNHTLSGQKIPESVKHKATPNNELSVNKQSKPAQSDPSHTPTVDVTTQNEQPVLQKNSPYQGKSSDPAKKVFIKANKKDAFKSAAPLSTNSISQPATGGIRVKRERLIPNSPNEQSSVSNQKASKPTETVPQRRPYSDGFKQNNIPSNRGNIDKYRDVADNGKHSQPRSTQPQNYKSQYKYINQKNLPTPESGNSKVGFILLSIFALASFVCFLWFDSNSLNNNLIANRAVAPDAQSKINEPVAFNSDELSKEPGIENRNPPITSRASQNIGDIRNDKHKKVSGQTSGKMRLANQMSPYPTEHQHKHSDTKQAVKHRKIKNIAIAKHQQKNNGHPSTKQRPTILPTNSWQTSERTYIVKKGDTLWDIANTTLGDPLLYLQLSNKSNVENPDIIYPGDILYISTTTTEPDQPDK